MKRILIVDDEEMYRQTLSAILGQAGFTVLEAEDGEKAVGLARDFTPDLIISDVMMERLDGFGLLDRLRMDPATSVIPFIFLTGLSDKESMRKGMSQGADDFLVKPFTGSELLSAVDVRLTKHEEMIKDAEKKLSQLRSSIALALPHEIRTPLTSILGFADVLAEDGASLDGEEVVQCGKLIQKGAQRMQRLLENFMIYAQIEVCANDPARITAFRKSRLTDSEQMIRPLSRSKAESHGRLADLVLDLAESPVVISESYLTKICDELLDNAFKFSEPRSEVRVSTGCHRDSFFLSVADHGRGMTKEQVANLGAYLQFERKLHEQQGTGLGLIIAKRLTELHGGRVEFESTSGGGLTVTIYLPQHPREWDVQLRMRDDSAVTE
ncbi:MAG: hybrid sensor histidine kinase/response regulator [Ignavibacteria bacterium]|nr:hybrid sensor histidine kinase/response regulator [Ignavibacteria bacterium]